MKANQFIKCKKDDGNVQLVGSIIALFVAIIIGIMVYFQVTGGVTAYDDTITETFTGYAASANASAWSVTVDYSPVDSTNTNVTCYNATGPSESYPTFSLSFSTISVAADAADEFSQVNVTYVSHIASLESDATDMATTVFGLAPLIGLVLVAAVLLGVILAFGRGRRGGGL